MAMWIVFALECIIFLGLSYWAGREVVATLKQAKTTAEKVMPIVKEFGEYAREAQPVAQRVQVLMLEARGLAQMAQQTQAQARLSFDAIQQLRGFKQSFQDVRTLAAMLLPQRRKPKSRLERIAEKTRAFIKKSKRKRLPKILVPAGIGAALSASLIAAYHRFFR